MKRVRQTSQFLRFARPCRYFLFYINKKKQRKRRERCFVYHKQKNKGNDIVSSTVFVQETSHARDLGKSGYGTMIIEGENFKAEGKTFEIATPQTSHARGIGTSGCGIMIIEGDDFIAEGKTFEIAAPQASHARDTRTYGCGTMIIGEDFIAEGKTFEIAAPQGSSSSMSSVWELQVNGVNNKIKDLAIASYILYDGEGNTKEEKSVIVGNAKTSHNQAEYYALLDGFQSAINYKVQNIVVSSHSEVVVKHMTGEYKCQSKNLISLQAKAIELTRRFDSFQMKHIRVKTLRLDVCKLAQPFVL